MTANILDLNVSYFVSCPEVSVMKRRQMTRTPVYFIFSFLCFLKLNDEEG